MALPFWKLRVENLTMDGQGSDGLPTDNFECGSDDGKMIFSDGDFILYTPDNGDPLPDIVVGFDGTKYDIKLNNGTKMTVDERYLVRHNCPGDTSTRLFSSVPMRVKVATRESRFFRGKTTSTAPTLTVRHRRRQMMLPNFAMANGFGTGKMMRCQSKDA
jgi:hypothetical protein